MTERDKDVQSFIQAVQDDEYAELTLPTGDVLITDWEGDGVFNPYVVEGGEHGNKHPTDILDDIADAVAEKLGVAVNHVEYSPNNNAFYVKMDRPE